MSLNSLFTLSNELIIEILKPMESFTMAIWNSDTSHSRWICYGILSDIMICYHEAVQYAKAGSNVLAEGILSSGA